MDRSDAIDRALKQLNDIEDLHNKFISQFKSPGDTRAGSILSKNGEFELTCLGVAVGCCSRRVFLNEEIFYEYHFFAEMPFEIKVPLVCVYLTIDGRINSPLPQGSRVCDFDNEHIAERVVALVANSMLKSEVFAPKK